MRTAKAPKPNIEALQDAVFKIDPDAIVIFGGANGIDIRIKAGAHNQVTFRSNTLAGIIAEALHFTPPRKLEFGTKNECLECRLRTADGKCRWIPGDYCRMTKSR